MDLFIDRLILGLQEGAIYASLALALVIIYRSSGLLNFAQGEMALFSGFLTWWLASTDEGLGLPVGLAILLSVAISFVGGALIERLLIRPVSGGPNPLPVVIVTIGLFLGLNALAGYLWGTDGKALEPVFGAEQIEVGPVTISRMTIGILVVLAVEVLLLWALFQKTKLGLGIRGVASNRESSALVGVPVNRMLMIGWGLAAALGAVAGSLYFSTVSFDTTSMQLVLIYAFAAATLGGFDSPVGAVVGGLIVGEVSVMASGYIGWIGGELRLMPAFILILGVLLIRPQGLFGKAQVSRV